MIFLPDKRIMRRQQHVLQLPERAVYVKRFLLEHIQHRAGEFSLPQCLHERARIDKAAAGGVYKNRAVLHHGKLRSTEHVMCFWCQSYSQHDDICCRQRGI